MVERWFPLTALMATSLLVVAVVPFPLLPGPYLVPALAATALASIVTSGVWISRRFLDRLYDQYIEARDTTESGRTRQSSTGGDSSRLAMLLRKIRVVLNSQPTVGADELSKNLDVQLRRALRILASEAADSARSHVWSATFATGLAIAVVATTSLRDPTPEAFRLLVAVTMAACFAVHAVAARHATVVVDAFVDKVGVLFKALVQVESVEDRRKACAAGMREVGALLGENSP